MLLNYIINSNRGFKIAIIVNDMSEVNIDSINIKNNIEFKRSKEKLVELSNGCICCTLRLDLVNEVKRLAKTNKFDYLLIESTGMAEPLPIAQAFTIEDDLGRTLYDLARIDTMATVIDGFNFYDQINSIETYKEASIERSKTNNNDLTEIPIAKLFIDQIEFCNLIIINKIDLISKEKLNSIETIIKKLNPKAEIIHSEYSRIDLSKILNTNKFIIEEAQNTEKWIEELENEMNHKSEIEEFGISSFAWKTKKPFNPEKLNKLLKTTRFENVIRSKGFIWVATLNGHYLCASFNIVGEIKTLEPMTIWWSAIQKSKWGNNKKEIKVIEDSVKFYWDQLYGDRRNELIFIGRSINKENLIKLLEDCLLTDDEFKMGENKWFQMFNDPFTEWTKVLNEHPMKKNFKEMDGEWEDADDEEIDEDLIDEK